MPSKSPFRRGYDHGLGDKRPAPAFPKGDATWSEKLYHRGWHAGTDVRLGHREPLSPSTSE